ncbi:hypothetical protein QE380_002190 [Acinetobacter baylyi]|uniref:Glycosyl transferase family 1 domain-containing protein n=1 Tax=Acinetobacter baylyi TaxID=202950 RepID=A0ABU0UXI2_ACIBI|nr:hypothetical protein [Acinetobacter baylyi]MDQ1209267.1 hypothetical protein [Acinetobacter baylyi]MDR6107142.1 hypothetical protein [Acinetobacter baylyi]MDR6186138.1 hypothetical protein [Acinetobacter baylyi]
MGKNRLNNIGYYSKDLNGHRASYLEFVQSKFGGERLSGKSLVFWKDPVFFLMIEDNFALYLLVSFLRVLIGRRTVGLLFRPKPAITENSLRLKIKKLALKTLRYFSNIRTLSIVPVPLEPAIEEIVDDWIYDFQLWDITTEQKLLATEIRQRFKQCDNRLFDEFPILKEIYNQNLNQKKVIVALGAQNTGKGTELLAKNMNGIDSTNYLIVVAGKFAQNIEYTKEVIQNYNGLIFDRYMTDDEILALYAVSDLVWCFYDPSYDQASGILGRAIQFGVMPIVRKGSFSESLCLQENLDIVSIGDIRDIKSSLDKILSNTAISTKETSNYEVLSRSKLESVLGLSEK